MMYPETSEIQFTRSHIFFGNMPHHALKTAVIISNDCHHMPLGLSLVNKLIDDVAKSERLCNDIHWLVWDVFHELNHWTAILEHSKLQLRNEV